LNPKKKFADILVQTSIFYISLLLAVNQCPANSQQVDPVRALIVVNFSLHSGAASVARPLCDVCR